MVTFLHNKAMFLLLLHTYFEAAESSFQHFWLAYSLYFHIMLTYNTQVPHNLDIEPFIHLQKAFH